jgi:hypothetical protein
LLSQRIKYAESKSWCLGMLRECLVFSSMRLGVPFIAPRQLGAVECIPGRQFLPSVAWRTGQSGAPPDTVQCGSLSLFGEADRWRLGAVGAPDTVRCGSPSLFGEADRWRFGAVGAPDTARCTPDSPVPPFRPLARPRVSGGSRGRPLARPTVGSTDSPVHTRQSGEL